MTVRIIESIRRVKRRMQFKYHEYLAPRRCVEIGGVQRRLSKYLSSYGHYEKVVVVASGPSSRQLDFNKRHLYLTCNTSYRLLDNVCFFHYLSDRSMVLEYLKNGVSSELCLGVLVWLEVSSFPECNAPLAKITRRYFDKYHRRTPEFFATDFYKNSTAFENYSLLEESFRAVTGFKFKQYNSGFGLVNLGILFASKLNLPLSIVGLDAGERGLVHYDGTLARGKSISGDSTKRKLESLLLALYAQSRFPVENHSFFLPRM